MFEKEAEEYADRTRIKDKNTYISFPDESITEVQDYEGNRIDIRERIEKAFKDGAAYGYQKANEWHFDKVPTDESDILCQIAKDEFVVGYYRESKKTYYTIDGQKIDVIAWKEIIFPELKEIEQ